jgi:hypothetical protein
MLTRESLSEAFLSIESRGWPDGNGPWIDAMDLALRTYAMDHQFAIVGYAIGVTDSDDAHQAAWKVLLQYVNKRARGVEPELANPGYRDRVPRPMSVLPGHGGGTAKSGFRRRR